MTKIINNFLNYYKEKKPIWFPVIFGIVFALFLPPFNNLLHPAFVFFPLLSFFICIPLFIISSNHSVKQSIFYSYIFGIFASAAQYYWIAFVVPEGLWHLILIGVILICLFEALYFLLFSLLFRISIKTFNSFYIILFPCFWVLLEYERSLGDISFPWNLIGYSLTPILPLSQLASITGVYGLSFIVVLGNTLVFNFLTKNNKKSFYGLFVFILFIISFSVWGYLRIKSASFDNSKSVKIAAIQCNLDQNRWHNYSLDTSIMIIDSLINQAVKENPEIIILPESAFLCYILRQPLVAEKVRSIARMFKISMIFGSLHWEKAPKGFSDDYLVYNTAFYINPNNLEFEKYYKMKLVPFSEALPFEGIFPILSRVNLGQADFKKGKEHVIFNIGNFIKAGPFICYEIIYPSLVRERVKRGANLLVNITNDGWFGKTSGAFQHATMAQLRCIENGVSLVRAANTGITMLVDQYGRIIEKKKIYTRTYLCGNLFIQKIPTIYSLLGDWPIWISSIIVIISFILFIIKKIKKNSFSG